MKIACAYGTVNVAAGDTFEMEGARWEIRTMVGSNLYSPSGMGGTPIIHCKLIEGEWPERWAAPEYKTPSGNLELCGDSVALYLHQQRNPHMTFDELKAAAA